MCGHWRRITGLETAEVLAAANQVTVVEMAKNVGATLYPTVKALPHGAPQVHGKDPDAA